MADPPPVDRRTEAITACLDRILDFGSHGGRCAYDDIIGSRCTCGIFDKVHAARRELAKLVAPRAADEAEATLHGVPRPALLLADDIERGEHEGPP